MQQAQQKKDRARVATCQYCDTLDRPYVCEQCGKTFARQDTLHRHSRLHNRAEDDAPTAKTGRKRRASVAGSSGTGIATKASSSGTSKAGKDGSGSSPSESSASSSNTGVALPIPMATGSSDLLVDPASPLGGAGGAGSYHDALGLSMSLPVGAGGSGSNHSLHGAPPSFPAYSQPATHAPTHQHLLYEDPDASRHAQPQQSHQPGQFPHFPSIDPAVIPLSRRYSDASHGAPFASQLALGTSAPSASPFSGTGFGATHVGSLPTSFVTSFNNGRTASPPGARGRGGGPEAGKRERPSLRPRALTLAGLPESLGCFSLVNSPEPSDAGSNSSGEEDNAVDDEDDDEDEHDGDDSMDLGDAVSRLIGSNGSNSTRTTASLGEPSAPPESHYPSPAFTCDSPSGLNLDPVADLRAILDNDPVPSGVFNHQQHHQQQQTLSPPPTGQPEFDFESFAASIEGPIRQGSSPLAQAGKEASAAGPTSFDELLSSTAHDFEGPPVLGAAAEEAAKLHDYSRQQAAADRYPTPPSGSVSGSTALQPDLGGDASNLFESSASYHLAEHIEKAISHIDDPARRASLGQYEADAADHAATAAMFSSGFGVSSAPQTPAAPASHASAAQLSALGLSFGLPGGSSAPPPTSGRHKASRHNSFGGFTHSSQPPAGSGSQAPLQLPMATAPLGSGSPYSAQQASFAAALSATYATAFPTLTLPIAGFDLPTMSSYKHDTPMFAGSPSQQQSQAHSQSPPPHQSFEKGLAGSAPPSSSSHFERLARAWEERQRAAGVKNPYAGSSPMSGLGKSTPAFYIPSATTGSRDDSP
ncbi:hypothetical protein JCM8202v2_003226 [Rhodotorula sphaerocarpa]